MSTELKGTFSDYINLRGTSGLTPPPVSPSIAEEALARSILTLTARIQSGRIGSECQPDVPIGMVRLIGDGHIFFTVLDMCVLPAFQGRGVGSKLLDQAIAWIDENAPNAYVMLIGDPPGQAMYKKKGFRQTEGIGMARSSWGR